MPADAKPIVVEAISGRSMTLLPEDFFIAVPGNRESVHWTVGKVPDGGLQPNGDYWLLAESGVVGTLEEAASASNSYLAQVTYLGAVVASDQRPLCLIDVALQPTSGATDAGAPAYLILGTSVEVGKTTAGLTLLRTLIAQGHERVAVLKATGTTSVSECAIYRDFGAVHVFDCLDFGVPATFPCARPDAGEIFERALDVCLSTPSDALIIECGGDFLGTCVPEFLKSLLPRRPDPMTILAAPDVSGAVGAQRLLEGMGVRLTLLTGPCTDTRISRERVEALCGVPARRMRT